MMTDKLKITIPNTQAEFDAVRQLCWEYRDFLLTLGPEDAKVVRTFYSRDKYAQIMDSLEQHHTPPNGGTKLACVDDRPVGCGMFHTLMPGTAEIKRVFVRDEARGLGVGRALMDSLLDQCRSRGYSRIVMDTGASMAQAKKLYLSMGFQLRGPYQEVPEHALQRMVFFEMEL